MTELAFVKDVPNQVKVREADSYELTKQLAIVLTHAAIATGLKGGIEDIHKREIKELILMRFKNLSLDEIAYAFKLERFGVLGDKTEHFQLFNASYVSEVLEKYRNWKREIRKAHNVEAAKQLPEITPEERAEIRRQFLKNIYEELVGTGYSRDAWHLYMELDQAGKLAIGDSKKKEVYEQQLEKYKKELKEQSLTRPDMKSILKRIEQGQQEGKSSKVAILRSKSFLASEYLSDYLESFKTFENHIESTS